VLRFIYRKLELEFRFRKVSKAGLHHSVVTGFFIGPVLTILTGLLLDPLLAFLDLLSGLRSDVLCNPLVGPREHVKCLHKSMLVSLSPLRDHHQSLLGPDPILIVELLVVRLVHKGSGLWPDNDALLRIAVVIRSGNGCHIAVKDQPLLLLRNWLQKSVIDAFFFHLQAWSFVFRRELDQGLIRGLSSGDWGKAVSYLTMHLNGGQLCRQVVAHSFCTLLTDRCLAVGTCCFSIT